MTRLVLCELADTGLATHESYSPFCLKVHRGLRLARLPYERRHGVQPASFRPLNPTGQVPVLLVGDEPVADSTRIFDRLETLAPGRLDGGLQGRAAAEAHLFEELADTAINGFLVAARWADDDNWAATKAAYFGAMPGLLRAVIPGRLRQGVVRTLVARDVWRAGPAACWRRFDRVLDQLEARAPAAGFWLGSVASRADVALFAQLHSLRTPLTPRQADAVAKRDRLTAWLERVDAATRSSTVVRLARAAA